MHDYFRRHTIRFALEALRLRILGAREVSTKDEARAVDQKHMMRRRRRGLRGDSRLRLGNERLNDLVHEFPTQTLRSFETLGGVVASAISVLCIARLTKRREQ